MPGVAPWTMQLRIAFRTLAALAVVALVATAGAQGAWTEVAWTYPEPGVEVRAFVAEATGGDDGRLVLGCHPPVGTAETGPLFVAFEAAAFGELDLEVGRLSWRDVTARYRPSGGQSTPITVDVWRRSDDGDVLFAGGVPASLRYAWVDELGAAPETTFSFWVGRQVESDPDVRMTVPTAGAHEVATERLGCFEGAG